MTDPTDDPSPLSLLAFAGFLLLLALFWGLGCGPDESDAGTSAGGGASEAYEVDRCGPLVVLACDLAHDCPEPCEAARARLCRGNLTASPQQAAICRSSVSVTAEEGDPCPDGVLAWPDACAAIFPTLE